MAAEDTPQWFLIWKLFRDLGIAAAAISAFFLYGHRLQSTQVTSSEVEARIKAQTEHYEIQLRSLQTAISEVERRKIDAEAQVTELEASRLASPTLVVNPKVDTILALDHVRQLRIEAHFTNVGAVAVPLQDISIQVFVGGVKPDIHDILYRTEQLAYFYRELQKLSFAPMTEENNNARDSTASEVERLHTDCPHGRLFLIDSSSQHIEWTHLPDLSTTRHRKMSLLPQQTAFEIFNFISTEHSAFHRNWFRFVLQVNVGTPTEQVFDFVIPTVHHPELQTNSPTEHSSVFETSHRVMRWDPGAPLIPSGPPKQP